ncbi:hypothetical protein GGS20DRAFT_212592 [Poronia punctata]|nr:hypothetical protein GGS20DRAFT_212592 [Poronia punctata]
MIIDGEKFACDACVRGHRVSNCHHSDRPLQHINKKGRPVSQCTECRAQRKSRSAHVKCDCGVKITKCVHLQPPAKGHTETCCCNHGLICTCCLKREPSLDPVPQSKLDAKRPTLVTKRKISNSISSARRSRANTSKTEPLLSSDLMHSTGHAKGSTIRRTGTGTGTGTGLSNRERATSTASAPDMTDHFGSEQASPLMASTSTFQQLNSQLPSLDISRIHREAYPALFASGNGLPDSDALFSAGLDSAVDWAQYEGLASSDSMTPSSFDPSQSYGFGVNSAEPTLASTSGNVSETEDFVGALDYSLPTFDPTSTFSNMAEDMTTSDRMMMNLDFDQFKNMAATTSTRLLSLSPSHEDSYYLGMTNFADGISHSPDPIATAMWD